MKYGNDAASGRNEAHLPYMDCEKLIYFTCYHTLKFSTCFTIELLRKFKRKNEAI